MPTPTAFSQFPLPNCPMCNADGSKRKWFTVFPGAYGAGSINIIVDEKHGLLNFTPRTTEAIPTVCTQCGNVQFFVDPNEVRDAAQPQGDTSS